jgi:hypothetical protein
LQSNHHLPEVWSLAATKADKDTLTYWDAIEQADKIQFVDAMNKEINAHTTKKHWELLP